MIMKKVLPDPDIVTESTYQLTDDDGEDVAVREGDDVLE